jgi:flotillin
METFILICVIVVLGFSLLIAVLRRYRRCPSDKIMVVYGNVGSNSDGSNRTQSVFTAVRPSYGL